MGRNKLADEVLKVIVKMDSRDVERLKVIAELKGITFAELTRQVLKHYADSKDSVVEEFRQAKEKLDSFDDME